MGAFFGNSRENPANQMIYVFHVPCLEARRASPGADVGLMTKREPKAEAQTKARYQTSTR